MLEACWLWFLISKEYVEITRPKIESRDPTFFSGTRSRSRVSGNDRLFPRGSEFGPNPEIPASPVIQLRPRPGKTPPTVTARLLPFLPVSDSAVQRQKSWVAQRINRNGLLGGPCYLWVVRIYDVVGNDNETTMSLCVIYFNQNQKVQDWYFKFFYLYLILIFI